MWDVWFQSQIVYSNIRLPCLLLIRFLGIVLCIGTINKLLIILPVTTIHFLRHWQSSSRNKCKISKPISSPASLQSGWWTAFSVTVFITYHLEKNQTKFLKEYLPNLLETWLLLQFFVSKVTDFKFWLFAYFFIFLNCTKFQQVWTTLK